MINNKNIFSCEELEHERSEEGLPTAIFAIGAFLHFIFIIWILISSLTDNVKRKSESKKEEKIQEKIKSNIDGFKNVWRNSFERRLKCEEIIKQTLEKSFSDYKFKKELFEYAYKNNNFCNKMNIYGRSIDNEGTGDETIVFNIDWSGDHHGTVQSLVRWINLDFSK